MTGWWMTVAATGVALGLAGTALAADPTPDPIKGSTVMGDKGRSGPDGWSWAPVTRDQGAGAAAPGAGTQTPNKQPDPQAGRSLPPGQDPGTPATAASAGPGTMNTAAGDRKP